MIRRHQKLSENNSLLLFGARGTGKSTLIKKLFMSDKTLWIDLLSAEDEDLYGWDPDQLSHVLKAKNYEKVVIDEIQKSPKLLDIVHKEIETHKNIQFIMSGSSARKLKHGGANLLAGRAFTYYLYPLSSFELGNSFDLSHALKYGSLPKLLDFDNEEDKNEFLRSYARNYLKEEIQMEQLVRNLNPFRSFLEVAAQSNGQIINYSKIARDVGVDDKTIRNYFSILEDTLVGYFLPPFHQSIRKRQSQSPKFYFFDTGVKRALDKTLRADLLPQTYAYGQAFEHWVISECFRLNDYFKLDYSFSYMRTKDGAEVDLIIERPAKTDLIIEIKSTTKVKKEQTHALKHLSKDWPKKHACEVWSLEKTSKEIDGIACKHWQEALKEVFF